MAAGFDSRDARNNFAGGAGRPADVVMCGNGERAAHKPFAVVIGDVDLRARKRSGPLGVRGVIVWVRYHNRLQPTFRIDEIDGRLINQGDHIPEYIAVRRAQQDGALADADLGLGVDAPHTAVMTVLLELVVMVLLQRAEGRPGLAGGRHELAGVVADLTI